MRFTVSEVAADWYELTVGLPRANRHTGTTATPGHPVSYSFPDPLRVGN